MLATMMLWPFIRRVGASCAIALEMGKSTVYRANWFRNELLIGTEPWDEATLEDVKKRARAMIDNESADRIEICKPSGEVVFQHRSRQR